jgi:hypothetical protein
MKSLILSIIVLFCCTGAVAQSWSHSTSTLHGGKLGLGAMTSEGSILDLWIQCLQCDQKYPSLVGAPRDQFNNAFTKIAWACPSQDGNCAHYRLTVGNQMTNFESVTGATYEIGNSIYYTVVMNGTK